MVQKVVQEVYRNKDDSGFAGVSQMIFYLNTTTIYL
jgi:uncharacterized protein (UPF0297 family)